MLYLKILIKIKIVNLLLILLVILMLFVSKYFNWPKMFQGFREKFKNLLRMDISVKIGEIIQLRNINKKRKKKLLKRK